MLDKALEIIGSAGAWLIAFALGYLTCALMVMAKWGHQQAELEARALTANRKPKAENPENG